MVHSLRIILGEDGLTELDTDFSRVRANQDNLWLQAVKSLKNESVRSCRGIALLQEYARSCGLIIIKATAANAY